MTNIRNVVSGAIASAIVAVAVVSCGGGGGYGGSGSVTYTVGGTLSGATGTVVLKLNGGSDLSMGNGPFTFAGGVANGSTFNVQVVAANQRCTVANGAGTMGVANITNVAVTCAAQGAEVMVRSASADGTQAGTGATGTGRGAVVVDPTTREITGGIRFTGLTGAPTGAHIHRGDNNIAIALTIAADNATATIPPGTLISNSNPDDFSELLAGTLYFNVHTAAYPNGEIRGQVNLQGGVVAGLAALDGVQESATNTSTATGRGTIAFDSATRAILVAYVTHNVTNTTVAHIHTGAPGVSGPANVVTLTQGTNIYTAPVGIPPNPPTALSAQAATDVTAGNTYFNVHSTNNSCPPAADCSAGEIRGQIVIQ